MVTWSKLLLVTGLGWLPWLELITGSDLKVEQAHRRYDYKRSLKQPMKVAGSIPGYTLFDKAEAGDQYIRLSFNIPGSQGSIWGESVNEYNSWEVEFAFHMSTKGTLGKDGVAFWYTEESGHSGPILGNQDLWKGVGVLFDSFVQPGYLTVTGVNNDGTKQVAGDISQAKFAKCTPRFLRAMDPIYVKVTHKDGHFKVSVDTEQRGHKYIPCFESSTLNLPTDYYFGLSAASLTEPANDHDLVRFSVYELDPPAKEMEVEGTYEEKHIKNGQLKASEEELKRYKDLEDQQKNSQPHYYYDDPAQTPQVPTTDPAEALQNVLKSLDYLTYRVDTGLPSSSPKATTPAASSQRPDIIALTTHLATLTEALHEAQQRLTTLESQVRAATRSQRDEFGTVHAHVATLSQKINSMIQHGRFQFDLVDTKFSNVSHRLWHLFLLGIAGAIGFVLYFVYRAKSSNSRPRQYL